MPVLISCVNTVDNTFSLATPMLQSDQELPQPQMFSGTLKAYQLKGMNWLANLYDQGINGILADEMGLGKTVQSVAFMAHLAEVSCNAIGPFLLVSSPQSWTFSRGYTYVYRRMCGTCILSLCVCVCVCVCVCALWLCICVHFIAPGNLGSLSHCVSCIYPAQLAAGVHTICSQVQGRFIVTYWSECIWVNSFVGGSSSWMVCVDAALLGQSPWTQDHQEVLEPEVAVQRTRPLPCPHHELPAGGAGCQVFPESQVAVHDTGRGSSHQE